VAVLIAQAFDPASLNPSQRALLPLGVSAGGMCLSNFNDAGFWVLSRYFGISKQVMLKTWTAGVTLMGCVTAAIASLWFHPHDAGKQVHAEDRGLVEGELVPVVLHAGRSHVIHVLLGPLLHFEDDAEKRVTARRELVVRAHGNGHRDAPRNQSVTFQRAQRGGEHLLAGTRNPLAEITVALLTIHQGKHYKRHPFAADRLKQLACRAKVQGRVVALLCCLTFLFSRESHFPNTLLIRLTRGAQHTWG
jgi:hypothetical protein